MEGFSGFWYSMSEVATSVLAGFGVGGAFPRFSCPPPQLLSQVTPALLASGGTVRPAVEFPGGLAPGSG